MWLLHSRSPNDESLTGLPATALLDEAVIAKLEEPESALSTLLIEGFLLFMRGGFGGLCADRHPAQFTVEGTRTAHFHHGPVMILALDAGNVLVGRKAGTLYCRRWLGRGCNGEEKNAQGNERE